MQFHATYLCDTCSGVTVRVTYQSGLVMYFGNSYKSWDEQFKEHQRDYMNGQPVIKFEKAKIKWIGGGAKWRNEENYIKEIKENFLFENLFEEFSYQGTQT